MILRQNNRIPTQVIVLGFLQEYSLDDIRTNYAEIRKDLYAHGIEAVVSIELSRDDKRKPNNRVHFHFLTDDPRTKDELKVLFNMACQRAGLVRGQDFRILIYPLYGKCSSTGIVA